MLMLQQHSILCPKQGFAIAYCIGTTKSKDVLSVTGCIGQGARHEAAEGDTHEKQEGSLANHSYQAAAAPADDGMHDLLARMEDLKAGTQVVQDAQVCIYSAC